MNTSTDPPNHRPIDLHYETLVVKVERLSAFCFYAADCFFNYHIINSPLQGLEGMQSYKVWHYITPNNGVNEMDALLT